MPYRQVFLSQKQAGIFGEQEQVLCMQSNYADYCCYKGLLCWEDILEQSILREGKDQVE
jgi:hypothetical protein